MQSINALWSSAWKGDITLHQLIYWVTECRFLKTGYLGYYYDTLARWSALVIHQPENPVYMMVYRCLHGSANDLFLRSSVLLRPTSSQQAIESTCRQRRISSSTAFTQLQLLSWSSQRAPHSTFGDHAFAVAGPPALNRLPAEAHCSSNLCTLKGTLASSF